MTGVRVVRTATGAASYRHLSTCGSVWACPVCAAKITEHRRQELESALESHRLTGGVVFMVTRTIQHTRWDDLAQLLRRLSMARNGMKKTRRYRRLREVCGIVGTVYALEVTYGANGWHPHEHELVFIEGVAEENVEAIREMLEAELAELWRLNVIRAGLRPTNEYGLRVDGTDDAVSEYVAKWGAAEELTKSHVKRAGKGGKTPTDILCASEAGDQEAGRLWKVYAAAFKGKRQLFWSKGLRKHLGLDQERSDQEVAESAEEDVETIAFISIEGGRRSDWHLVLAHRGQARVLEAAELDGEAGVRAYIARLRSRSRARPAA